MSRLFMDENYLSLPSSSDFTLTLNKTTCKTPGSQTKGKGLCARSTKKKPLCKLGRSLQGIESKNVITGGDRFVPDRSNIDFDLSHYLLNNDLSQKDTSILNQYSDDIADISVARVVSYQAFQAPKTDAYKQKIIYSAYKSNTLTKSKRYIPTTSERILDAPDITNNFYLKLIDWSSKNILAVALKDEVYLWNASSGHIDNLLELEGENIVTSVSFSSAGNYLAVGTEDGVIQLWDVNKKKKLRCLMDSQERIACSDWNENVITGGSKSGKIYNYDVRVSPSLISKIDEHKLEVCGLKWDPSGKYLASGANDNTVMIWDHAKMTTKSTSGANRTWQPLTRFTEHQAAIKAIAWCPWKPSTIATGGGTADRKLRIWNSQNGINLNFVDTQSQISAVLWSEEYRELITSHGFQNNELIIWKYSNLQKTVDLIGHQARILGMAMSPDSSTVVSLGADETLRFWECFQVDESRKKAKEKDKVKDKENASSRLPGLQLR